MGSFSRSFPPPPALPCNAGEDGQPDATQLQMERRRKGDEHAPKRKWQRARERWRGAVPQDERRDETPHQNHAHTSLSWTHHPHRTTYYSIASPVAPSLSPVSPPPVAIMTRGGRGDPGLFRDPVASRLPQPLPVPGTHTRPGAPARLCTCTAPAKQDKQRVATRSPPSWQADETRCDVTSTGLVLAPHTLHQ